MNIPGGSTILTVEIRRCDSQPGRRERAVRNGPAFTLAFTQLLHKGLQCTHNSC